jgi:hypothetical protein
MRLSREGVCVCWDGGEGPVGVVCCSCAHSSCEGGGGGLYAPVGV